MAITNFNDWYKKNKKEEETEEEKKRKERLSKQGFKTDLIPEGRDDRLASSGFSTDISKYRQLAAESKKKRQSPLFETLEQDIKLEQGKPTTDAQAGPIRPTMQADSSKQKISLPSMNKEEADMKVEKESVFDQLMNRSAELRIKEEIDKTKITAGDPIEVGRNKIQQLYKTDPTQALKYMNELIKYEAQLKDNQEAMAKATGLREGAKQALKLTGSVPEGVLDRTNVLQDALIGFVDALPVVGKIVEDETAAALKATSEAKGVFDMLDIGAILRITQGRPSQSDTQGVLTASATGNVLDAIPFKEMTVTPFDVGKVGGTAATFYGAAKVASLAGKASMGATSALVKTAAPKTSTALTNLLVRLNAAGVSGSTFRAITGQTQDDSDMKSTALDMLGGYGIGLLFGALQNRQAIKTTVFGKIPKDGYFNGVESIDDLFARKNDLEASMARHGSDPTTARLRKAVQKEFDGLVASILNETDEIVVKEVLESAMLTSPSVGALATIDGQTLTGINNIAQAIINNGGITIDLKGHIPAEGYALAVSGYERKIPADTFTKNDVAEFVKDNHDILSQEGNHVGGWVNDETNEVVLDVSRVEPDREKALSLAKKRGEDAIYNLGTGEEIKTGIGDKPVTLRSDAMKKIIDDDGMITAYHYSPISSLKTIDPEQMGTSLNAGQEMTTQFEDGKMRKGFLKKSNFFTKTSDGVEAHRFGMQQKYEAKIDPNDVYDWKLNPLRLKSEQAIKDAGFDGYFIKDQLRMFSEKPVTLLGKSNIDKYGKPIGGKAFIPVKKKTDEMLELAKTFKSADEFDAKISKGGYGTKSIGEVVESINLNSKGALNNAAIRDELIKGGSVYIETVADPKKLNVDLGPDRTDIKAGDIDKTIKSEVPVVVSKDGYVVDGRHRTMAAIERGDKEIKVLMGSKEYYDTNIVASTPKSTPVKSKAKSDAIVPEVKEVSAEAKKQPDFIASELGVADQKQLKKYNKLLAEASKKELSKSSRLAIMDLIETKEKIPALKVAQKTLVKTMRERQKAKITSLKATQAKKDLARKESKEVQKVNRAKSKAISSIGNMLKKTEKLSSDYQKAIKDLTDGFDVARLSDKKAESLKAIRMSMLEDDTIMLSKKQLAELERLEKVPFRDMDLEDVQRIESAVKMVIRHAQTDKKLILESKLRAVETVTELTSSYVINLEKPYKKVREELEASVANTIKDKNIVKKLYGPLSDSPMTLAHRLGPAMEEIMFDQLLIGTEKQYDVEYTAVDKISALHEKYKIQDWYSTKPKDLIKVKLNSGQTLTINKQTRIGFQMAWNDVQARRRLLEGGFTLSDFDTEIMKITPNDFQRIVGDMTAAEKEFIETYYEWNKSAMEMGNQVSVSMDGVDTKFLNDKYYHIRTSPLSLQANVDPFNNAKGASIENRGVFRERVDSKKPLVIVGGVDAWYATAKEMAAYIGMAIPMRNSKLMLRQPEMKNIIVKAYGKDYYHSMENYLRDIELQAVSPSAIDTFASRMLAHTQASAIIGNIGIMFKQTVSLATAATEVPMKYLLQGLKDTLKNPKAQHKIAVDSSSMMRKRFEGYATPELRNLQDANLLDTFVTGKSRTLKDLARVKGVGEKVKTFESVATKGIKLFDEVTILAIRKGVEIQLAEKNPLWSKETLRFETAEKTHKVIAGTQPNAGPLFKPELTRSKSAFVKGMTQFTNQALQNYNIGKRTRWDYQNSKKTVKDKKEFLRKMSLVFAVSPFVIGAIDTAKKKLRGDDVNIMNYLADSVFAGLGSLPLFTPIRYAIQRGENVQSTLSSSVVDLIQAIGKTPDAIIERDFDTIVPLVDQFLQGLAPFAGVPYSRLKRSAFQIAEASSADLAYQLNKTLSGSSSRTDEYTAIFEAAKSGTNLKAAQTAIKDLTSGEEGKKKVTMTGIKNAIDSRNAKLPVEERLTTKELQPYLESLFEFTTHPEHISQPVIKVGDDYKDIPTYWFKEDKYIELEKRGVSRGVLDLALMLFKTKKITRRQDRIDALAKSGIIPAKSVRDILEVYYGYEF